MKLRYLYVDRHGQLTVIRRAQVEALWQGRLGADALSGPDLHELRLVSVLCNARLIPQKIFLLRLPLTDGHFTRDNYRTLRSFSMPSRVTAHEMFVHHSEGWPSDFFRQMAVALDVSLSTMQVPMGVGGPLFVAAALRVSPREALRYLR